MFELTEEQLHQLQDGKAVNITDAQTAQCYVVMRRDFFDRVRRLIYDDSDWSDEELRLQLARSAKENGWDEPAMNAYDHYDEERRKQ